MVTELCLPMWWAARSGVRRARQKLGPGVPAHMQMLFWNARGIVDDADAVIDFMDEKNIVLGCCMETEVYENGDNMSRGFWDWHAGPEHLPALGEEKPPLGLGAYTDKRRLPNA